MKFNEEQPIYLQIANYLCSKILQGEYLPDSRVPSVRTLGTLLEVNPNTAVRSLDLLENRGVLVNRRGMGYFVAPKGPEVVFAMRKEMLTEQILPKIFDDIILLKIDFKEIESLFIQYQNKVKNENK